MKKLEKKRCVVVPILMDAILFARISNRMMDILNAFNPKVTEQEFEPEVHYHGICNAITVLKIKDENLDNILENIFNDFVYGNNAKQMKESDLEVRELADIIFAKWSIAIKKYNSSYKIAV
ncbi:hypothetical protein [Flavobacterium sp. UMI-01]|uniref:hypothetical protein n=1 Tax=Flavobacterium sp. UMI-01 TaxID=1441053 RepID=UPI001C7E199C|nr:hypothetical protein [Flavobacterium sp. UMI-01]GIZ08358.1 hypothetical protein FUMI01_10850 [Flavobacterium sp. UMI-01]